MSMLVMKKSANVHPIRQVAPLSSDRATPVALTSVVTAATSRPLAGSTARSSADTKGRFDGGMKEQDLLAAMVSPVGNPTTSALVDVMASALSQLVRGS